MFSSWLVSGEVTVLVIDFLKTPEKIKVNIGGYSFYEAGLGEMYF